jgi:hypothetical protein
VSGGVTTSFLSPCLGADILESEVEKIIKLLLPQDVWMISIRILRNFKMSALDRILANNKLAAEKLEVLKREVTNWVKVKITAMS